MASPGSAEHDDRSSRSDAELLVEARQDPEAFTLFYRRNFRPVLSYFRSRTLDREVASELTAETFAVALAGVERYDPARGMPQQWLYGIAANQLRQLWRSRRVSSRARRRLEIETPAAADRGWEEFEAVDARLDGERITAALSRVPAKSREAVRLRVIEQLDYGEIARRMGCKRGTARSLVFRGLRRLSDEFDRPSGCGP
jgi:RNA polymerase sigma-70 factor (ECF subfamily)